MDSYVLIKNGEILKMSNIKRPFEGRVCYTDKK